MQYRTHDDGPLTTITIKPGAVVIDLEFDLPGCFNRLHSHTFPHWMRCISGSARIVIDDIETIVRKGDRYLVEAGKQHGVWPLESGTHLQCEHNHPDIHPDKMDGEGIPLEWLDRLTDKVAA